METYRGSYGLPTPICLHVGVGESDFDDEFEFYWCAHRQLGYSDRRSGMRTCLPEYVAEQLGRPVEHGGLRGEPGCRGDESDHFHHPGHRVETNQVVHRGQRVEHADSGQLPAPGGVDLDTEL